jgi:hypothetical protein
MCWSTVLLLCLGGACLVTLGVLLAAAHWYKPMRYKRAARKRLYQVGSIYNLDDDSTKGD